MEFVRKRLQIFVSSTFTDLILDRQAAVEAILTSGHIPAGTELFTSGDESQMDIIKQWIDESDIYLLILGGRYGSIEPVSGKSYTELEYEYAVSINKPLFACVIKDAALEMRIKLHGSSVIETQSAQKLINFRQAVLKKMVRFWEDSKDIKISVGETLSHFSRRSDLVGWVRPSEQANLPALADEVARLSRENAELRNRLDSERKEPDFFGLKASELREVLESKNLFSDLLSAETRSELGKEFWNLKLISSSGLTELSAIGLIRPTRLDHDGDQWYQLSDEGRKFLNRVDVDMKSQIQVISAINIEESADFLQVEN